MKQLKLLLFFACTLSLWQMKGQTPPLGGFGGVTLTPVSIPTTFTVIPTGDQILMSETYATNDIWYKWKNTSSITSVEINPITQGVKYSLKQAELYIGGDSTLTLVSVDSISSQNRLDLATKNIAPNSDIYIHLICKQTCSNCKGNSEYPQYTFKITNISPGCNFAQPNCELVVDGGFENFNLPCDAINIVSFPNDFAPCYWTGVMGNDFTADYYNTCADSYGSSTGGNYNYFNNNSYMNTHSGDGYVGIYAYEHSYWPLSGWSTNYREYVSQTLSAPLTINKTYIINMWVKLAETSMESINSLHAVFSTGSPANPYPGPALPGQQPITLSNGGAQLNSTNNWTLLTAAFTSPLAYDHILIGNYNDDANTTLSNPTPNQNDYAYYFIDDVSLRPLIDLPTNSYVVSCANTVNIGETCAPISGVTYAWVGANAFTISNSVIQTPSSNNTNLNFTATGTYIFNITVTYGSFTTTEQVTISVTIPPPPVVVINTTSSACPTANTTLSAANVGSYIWLPGNSNATTLVVNPTTPTTYAVTITDVNGCVSKGSILVNPISCCAFGKTDQAAIPTSGSIPSGSYSLNGTLLLTGNLIISDARFYMGTNAEIVIPNNGVLTINSSHLLGCPTMWKGIRCLGPNATIIITSVTHNLNTLIEDAITAIDLKNVVAPATGQTQIFKSNDATFNKNYVAVNVDTYNATGTYKADVVNTVFTSRKLITPEHVVVTPSLGGSINYNWPTVSNMSQLKVFTPIAAVNSLVNITPNTMLSTNDQFSVASYASANCEIPMQLNTGLIGIFLQNVYNTSAYTGFEIGGTVNPAYNTLSSLNLFDNLGYGIDALNSNVKSANAAYQYMHQVKLGVSTVGFNTYTGGIGLHAANNLSYGTQTFALTAVPTTLGYNTSSNIFINNAYGIKSSNVQFVDVNYNIIHSNIVYSTIPTASLFVTKGSYGIYMKSADYRTINANTNFITNITTGIVFLGDFATVTFYKPKPITFQVQNIGTVNILNNQLKANYGSSIGNRYMQQAIAVDNVLNPVSVTSSVTNPLITIAGNNVVSTFNGIKTSNWKAQQVIDNSNTITLVNNLVTNSTQTGILHQNNTKDNIIENNITGFGTTKVKVYAINASDNFSQSVYCNFTDNTYEGIRFGGSANLTSWQSNTLQSHIRGMHLFNTVIGQQGGLTQPTDNRWNVPGYWGGSNFHTFVTSLSGSTSPSNSVLYIRNSSNPLYKPTSNTSNSGTGYYLYPITIKQATSGAGYQCPAIKTTGGCLGCNTNTILLRAIEQMVTDSISYLDYEPTMRINSKHNSHRYLKQDPALLFANSTLQNFNNNYNANNVNVLENIEDALVTGNVAVANNLNTGLSPQNNIEANTQSFYSIYAKSKQGTYDDTDDATLLALANGCPERDGLVVYQARVLYNSINEVLLLFEGNCNTTVAARIGNSSDAGTNAVEAYNTIEVYPNPSTNSFNINLSTAGIQQASLKVYDVNGRLVLDIHANAGDKAIIELDLNAKNGIYFLVVTDTLTEVVYKQKLVIQK